MALYSSGNTFLVKTSKENPTSMVHVPRDKLFKFKMRSCESAKVTLLNDPADVDSTSYYFNIGAETNGKTQLYRNNNGTMELATEESTPSVLDCQYFDDYGITFDINGTFELRKGGDLSESLLTYDDSEPLPVQALTLGSQNDEMNPAEFEFKRSTGLFLP